METAVLESSEEKEEDAGMPVDVVARVTGGADVTMGGGAVDVDDFLDALDDADGGDGDDSG